MSQKESNKMIDEEEEEEVSQEPEEEEVEEIPRATKSIHRRKGRKYRSVALKRKKKPQDTYATYIYKVLKQVNPDMGISNKAMGVMDCFVDDMLERLLSESSHICRRNNSKTLTCREIQGAISINFPDRLAKHAISEGKKSVHQYESYDD